MPKSKTEQETFQETERIEREAQQKNLQRTYEEDVENHKKRIEDLKNQILLVNRAVDQSTDISGETMKLSDKVQGYRIGTALERVNFEKRKTDVEKAQAAYIGSLKQVRKLIEASLERTELNPPEQPQFQEKAD